MYYDSRSLMSALKSLQPLFSFHLKQNKKELQKLVSISKGFACHIMNINLKSVIGDPSSNSGLVSCIHFCTNKLKKY